MASFRDRELFFWSSENHCVYLTLCSILSGLKELYSVLKPYLLRRTKANVLKDLPDKSEVILYHGLTCLQKKLYKAILTKDLGKFI